MIKFIVRAYARTELLKEEPIEAETQIAARQKMFELLTPEQTKEVTRVVAQILT